MSVSSLVAKKSLATIGSQRHGNCYIEPFDITSKELPFQNTLYLANSKNLCCKPGTFETYS